MIAWDRVRELKKDLGEDDFDEVVQSFFEELDDRIAVMKVEKNRNWGEDLHFIKGCAANLGFLGLSELCQSRKMVGPDSFPEIETCYGESRNEFLTEHTSCMT